jgi:hypothetical protein
LRALEIEKKRKKERFGNRSKEHSSDRHSKNKLYFFLINGKIVLIDANCAREAVLPWSFRWTTASVNAERIINESHLGERKEKKTVMFLLVDQSFRFPSAVFVAGGI